jgi:hypothetical protein
MSLLLFIQMFLKKLKKIMLFTIFKLLFGLKKIFLVELEKKVAQNNAPSISSLLTSAFK